MALACPNSDCPQYGVEIANPFGLTGIACGACGAPLPDEEEPPPEPEPEEET